LVKPGSRPNLLQSAALGSASYRSANVCAAKLPRSFGNILECFQPGMEVAVAGLDNSTWIEAICREPRKRGLAKIVERGETMLSQWANVDVRAVRIAVLE
jgi:hypothetical protein